MESEPTQNKKRWDNVGCSQCGRDFGPGDHGFSHCEDHAAPCSPSPFDPPKGSFQKELERLINCKSIEGGSDTPDFILAEYLRQCLDAFDMATRRREDWYGRTSTPCDPPFEENYQREGPPTGTSDNTKK